MSSSLVPLGLLLASSLAQAGDKLEKVRDLCPGLSFEQRPTLVVPSPSDSAQTPSSTEQHVASLLNSALLNSGCFALRAGVTSDRDARYRVHITITEHSEQSRDALVVVNNEKLKVTFARFGGIVQVIDTETDALLASEAFDTKGKSTKGRSGSMSAAMSGAIDHWVAEVVEYLAPYRSRMAVGSYNGG